MARTRAQENRKIRQDELREKLAEQCRVDHVLDNIIKIEALDFECKGEDGQLDYKDIQGNKFKLDALKAANEQRLKLINKYLPDEKYLEIAGDPDAPILTEIKRTIVDPKQKDS